MKQFIVLAAVLPILMIFVMQAVCDQRGSFQTSIVQDMVYAAKEEAKLEGSFTPYIQEKLRRNLSKALGVPQGEVLVACWEDGDILHYRVEVPIKGVVAGNKLLGIKDEENQYSYVIDSYTVSKAN
ncbi:MAG: hypothetical protein FWG42_09880 [Clostridiales bacterium]|nr:hypothetical protein [Clostridiales bacterium]